MQRITLNPEICFGKPTIRNLRYPVELILELMSGEMTQEEILGDYPDLEREDLMACLYYDKSEKSNHSEKELKQLLDYYTS